MTSKKTYFITGGGTGGHIYPAIAVADELIKDENNEIYYIGNPNNMEYRIAIQKGYKFLPVEVKGMPRKLSLDLIFWCLQLFISIIKSIFYIQKYKPIAIFGTGGYVSAPVLFVAKFFNKVPYMLHDCDMHPGIVTRFFAKSARCVSLAFEEAKLFINNKFCFINGNPLRPEFNNMSTQEARNLIKISEDKLVLCVMGGSQGAKSINNSFVEIIKELSEKYGYYIIFQTGNKNYGDITNRLSKIYKDYERNKNLLIQPYFENMTTVLKSSDIVVSRAGSLSLSEIFASDVAPILVPYPHAAADHQRKNAQFVLNNNACFYLEDDELDPNSLLNILKDLKTNPEKIKQLKQNAKKLYKKDALKNIIEQLESVPVTYD